MTDENLVSPTRKPVKTKPRTRPQSSTEEPVKSKASNGAARRRNRLKSKSGKQEARGTTTEETIHSSLELVTPSYTTPAPPSTPDLGGGIHSLLQLQLQYYKNCSRLQM